MLQAVLSTLAVAALGVMGAAAQDVDLLSHTHPTPNNGKLDVSKLCAYPTQSLTQAITQYPDEAFALKEVLKVPMATWYGDWDGGAELPAKIAESCDQTKSLFVVVYGLPNKDCKDGYSNSGHNKNQDDYRQFIKNLTDVVGNRPALYVLEPDAVGLAATSKCAVDSHYVENVQMALGMLSNNANAEIYLDVGWWTLTNSSSALQIANVVKELQMGGRIKGIVLNTSNYHPTKVIAGYCSTFQKAYGNDSLHCIVDTSRNFNNNPPSDEWCNARFGGIGHPSTAHTDYANLDYYMWVKIPGESDGTCDGSGRSADSMVGPPAGAFFNEQFIKLWNQGWFVKEKGMKMIPDPDANVTTAPVTTALTNTSMPPEPTKTTKSPKPTKTPKSPKPTTTPKPSSL